MAKNVKTEINDLMFDGGDFWCRGEVTSPLHISMIYSVTDLPENRAGQGM
jgi:hypothetical protein